MTSKMKTSYEAFGIECNSGWEKLYGPLIDLCVAKGNTILQVKEKFGGLRFYYGGPYNMDALVAAAEAASYHTCEDCGESGVERWDPETHKNVYKATTGRSETSYWIRTLCAPCRVKWDEGRRVK